MAHQSLIYFIGHMFLNTGISKETICALVPCHGSASPPRDGPCHRTVETFLMYSSLALLIEASHSNSTDSIFFITINTGNNLFTILPVKVIKWVAFQSKKPKQTQQQQQPPQQLIETIVLIMHLFKQGFEKPGVLSNLILELPCIVLI